MKAPIRPITAANALVLAALAAGGADAIDRSRFWYTQPAGICQAALPAFEGAIRKRPLSIQNEGTVPAFVSCAFESQGRMRQIYYYFTSVDGVAHSASCTGISGINDGTSQSVVMSIPVPESGERALMLWNGSDFNEDAYFPTPYFSVSCKLDPGVALTSSAMIFEEDIGD